ncbi:hypothetical protein Q8W71_05195 [Methylobacterium sp. NEAU 140]|uniref:hypothetical protein n=1 Tax=Methylobacterium sp. NEAU 140 TaxID=3064945 RepID=UPI002732CC7F|nr:hypothetical protein [Methylobacterium sp. NEAU 140]MDP4022009.1 hypothetical protein [Methylobacterium sp. NEAU 140]
MGMSTVEKKIRNWGLILPDVAKPVANDLSYLREGNLPIVSGQLCIGADGKLADTHRGKLDAEIGFDADVAAAQLC